jgi:CRISPR-associated exonuclease Cas4
MWDNPELLFTITDLKQYTYCPRILYYHQCLPDVRPTTYKMQAGIDAHTVEHARAERRSLGMYNETEGQRRFNVAVHSHTLQLSGRVDEVVETPTELFLVEYKLSRKAGYHFKLQLAAYTLVLEEMTDATIRRGFIYLIPLRKAVEVPITTKLRRAVRHALAAMRSIALQETMPPPTEWQQRCVDCEFRRFCNDV